MESGYTGLFFGRIDYQDLKYRTDPSVKAAEFVWESPAADGGSRKIFSGLTGEYGGNYGPPSKFCFDLSLESRHLLGQGRHRNPVLVHQRHRQVSLRGEHGLADRLCSHEISPKAYSCTDNRRSRAPVNHSTQQLLEYM